ncbi:MAG: YheU family protein [Proteobacteria bacterium]|nr:YheU family protein [Pseudomonadota bacterium]
MEIPYDRLSAEVLRKIIEEFVLREGTDYGEQQFSLDQKVSHVEAQLRKRAVVVVYDQVTETVSLVRRT